ncbi:MAG: ABC transporter ATP-binding protein [Bacteroidales bacterium]|jgi:NitT/TauT family transport system ATP-binding protein|nr:ABC transporter ATP-binding protein [Bacteroidales bacterium]
MKLEIKGLYKDFDDVSLFRDFSINIPEGKITCILGPSGCGKTTLLNIIGNIIQPDRGELEGVNQKVISYIFQDPRLLPWKTVKGNIEFVINKDLPGVEREELASRFMRLVELEEFAAFYPSKLSGGMRQRVSIARAFAYPSDLFLMDEPLKGRDIKNKLNLIRTFSKIWEADKRTVVFVTHDVDEALLLGNEILVLSQAPVRIDAHKKVEVPIANRSLDSAYLKELKQMLLHALGK